jgi:azurin
MWRLRLLLVFALVADFASPSLAEETAAAIRILPGMRFDPPRLIAPPGAHLRITLHNEDSMQHNFVLAAPGKRLDVLDLALRMAADGPAKQYVPETPFVLQHTKILNPGGDAAVEFIAPASEAVYPFLCTLPGHGYVMYGVLYITKKSEADLPPLIKDANVSPLSLSERRKDLKPPTRPLVRRTFMPDCGPAAIAVGLPGGLSCCWDAGACRLRYAWIGGFIDDSRHLDGPGMDLAELLGPVFYREAEFPIRPADNPALIPSVRFHGYTLEKNGPQFRYEVDGLAVRESIAATADGAGLLRTFEIENTSKPILLFFPEDPNAKTACSAGELIKGRLTLSPQQARRFTVTLTPSPGKGAPP